ncbi:hypothetical protein, partial [Streptomyces sp. NRRL WC-3725]|uniref:hypothetical protein n=1 Tax=Streptomyces sp. NRRL WC-3725 TaxID=1463933 RepID=UPI001F39BAAE
PATATTENAPQNATQPLEPPAPRTARRRPVIRIDLADIRAADRLVEALYVAAGVKAGTHRATHWQQLAGELERALDALPPQPLRPVTTTMEAA